MTDKSDRELLVQVATGVATIEERTKNMVPRLNDHAKRIHSLEIKRAENTGKAKGREFSLKRVVIWVGLIVTILGGIATIIAITPP